jgi:hypothetical protein
MRRAATRLLDRLDLVGVFERLGEWLQLVCELAAISPCPPLPHLNAKHSTRKTEACEPPEPGALAAAVREHALADVQLHAHAAASFELALERHRRGASRVARRRRHAMA